MEFTLQEQQAKFVNFNPRPELHGENPKPAADLHFAVNVPNDDLAELHPDLKGLLYVFDATRGGDLIDEARKEEKGYLPHLRFPKLGGPLKWKDEIIGAPVTVKYGKAKVKLDGCIVCDLKIEPQEGGTVTLGFRVQGHPTEKDAGHLYMMVGQTVEVTVEESKYGDEPPTSTE